MSSKRKKGISLASKIAKQSTQVIKSKVLQRHKKPIIKNGSSYRPAGSNGLRALHQLRKLPEKHALYSLRNILNKRGNRDQIVDFQFPKTIEIKGDFHYGPSDKGLDFDLIFEAEILKSFGEDISFFLKLKNEFEHFILKGDIQAARSKLDEVYRLYGYSFWYICSLQNLMYEEGRYLELIEYNTRNLSEFESENYNPIAKVAVMYSTAKCEKGISFERFEFSIQNQAEEFRLSENYPRTELLEFENLYSPEKAYKFYQEFILSNSTSNIVDRYLGFRRIITSCLIHGESIEKALPCLHELKSVSHDSVLSNALCLHGEIEVESNDFDRMFVEICDLYVAGNYSLSSSKCEDLLNINPSFVSCVEIYIKSIIRIGKSPRVKGLIGRLIQKLYLLYNGGAESNLIKDVKKEFLRLSHFDWAYFLKIHFEKFSTAKESHEIDNLYLFVDVQCSLFNPFSIACQDFSKLNYPNNNSVSYYWLQNADYEMLDSSFEINNFRLLKLNAEVLYKSKEYRKAVDIYFTLQDCHDVLFKTDAMSKIVSCYFNMGDYYSAISFLSGLVVEYGGVAQLPIKNIAQYILSDENHISEQELIDRAIVLDFYISNSNHDKGMLSLLCEDLLERRNIDSNYTLVIRQSERELYLFSQVIYEDVLEQFDMFDYKDEVYIFRIFIIQKLLKVLSDKKKKDDLKVELFKVFEKLVKERCLVECGLGRVEVDLQAIRSVAQQQVFEEFVSIVEGKVEPVYETDFVDVENLKDGFSVSKNQYFNKILELYYKVRDIYTVHQTHGLDNFLNMNIRHGGIVNLLWSPIKKYKLAFLKNEKGFYEVEVYWFEQYPYLRSENQNLLREAFTKFSKSIDKYVSEAKSWIHINTGEFPSKDRMFNFPTETKYIMGLCGIISKGCSFEQLVNNIFENLELTTEASLKSIHGRIDNELTINLQGCFEVLLKDVQEISALDELNKKIKLAQVEMREKLVELKSWLAWKKETSQNFTFSASINAARDMAKSLHPLCNLNLEVSDSLKKEIFGEFFRKFTTFFLILIDNAIVHSDKGDDVDIEIDIIPLCDGLLRMSICSIFNEDKLFQLSSIVKDINNVINDKYIDKANEEKGSGLFKIKKILTNDLKFDNTVSLAVSNEKFMYIVNIDADLRRAYAC